jgi:hypothetical protein
MEQALKAFNDFNASNQDELSKVLNDTNHEMIKHLGSLWNAYEQAERDVYEFL